MPLVTIITPTYNRASLLEETMESILSQKYPKLEYIIVDDGSIDNTREVVAKFQKKYKKTIRYIKQKNNGETSAVNKGFSLAKGKYIAVINSDDPLLPGSISEIIEYLEEHSPILAVYPDWEMIDEKSHPIQAVHPADYDYLIMLKEHYCMPGPGTFFHKKVLELTGGRSKKYRYLADFAFWLKAGMYGQLYHLPKTLATFRVHNGSQGIYAKGKEMAQEHKKLVDDIFKDSHLPKEAFKVRQAAYAAAYFHAAKESGSFLQSLQYYFLSLFTNPFAFASKVRYEFTKIKQDTLKRGSLFFLGILLLFLAKGIFFIFLIPPFEAPDEPSHIKYAINLFHNPTFLTNKFTMGIGYSLGQSWNYQKKYTMPKLQTRYNSVHRELFQRNNYQKEPSLDNITGNPPLYYFYLLPFYGASLSFPSYISIVFLRFGSLMLGGISLVFFYHIARLLFPKSQAIPLICVLVIALHPMFTFITSVVNNDNGVILALSAFFYYGMRLLVSSQKKLKEYLFTAIIVGIAALSKPQALLVVPIFGWVLLQDKKLHISRKVLCIFVAFLLPLIWYGVMTHFSYSYTVGISKQHSLALWKYPIDFLKAHQPIGVFMSFWGYFGWLDVVMPKWIYASLFLTVLLAGAGWVKAFFQRRLHSTALQKNIYIFLGSTAVLYIVAMVGIDWVKYIQTYSFAMQGRYFLPLLCLLIFPVVQGILFFQRRVRIFLLGVVIVVFILSQISMYTTVSYSYYHTLVFLSPLVRAYLLPF